MRKQIIAMVMALTWTSVWAQGPNNTGTYYSSANGKKGAELKTALYQIIKNPNTVSYDGLIDAYRKTDTRPDGYVRDWYSNTTNFRHNTDKAGSYKKEGDVYNREHLVPQSWGCPKSDVVHVVPTDGYVNNRRGNNPLGETDNPTYKSNNSYSKLGPCSVSGHSGTVFEPNDEVKGDIARVYFYMVTCYEDRCTSWGNDVFTSNKYPGLTTWTLNMMLRWATLDPVDSVEWARNNAVQQVQGNRNPFVDYPGLEDYVWGDKKDTAFNYQQFDENGWQKPTPDPDPQPDPDPNPDPDPQPDPDDPSIEPDVPAGEHIYNKVATTADLTVGDGYLIVCESTKNGAQALSGYLSNSTKAMASVSVSILGSQIKTEVNTSGKPHEVTLGGATDSYTLYDSCDKTYLALTSSSNALNHVEDATTAGAKWTITISNGAATIQNKEYNNRTLRYNNSSPRFACYTSGQEPVALYKRIVTTGIKDIEASSSDKDINVFGLDGRVVRSHVSTSTSLQGLPKGIYLIQGRKIVVR